MRLKINDSFLDQYEDTVIAQTFGVFDFKKIDQKQGSLSNSFKLPLTSNNAVLLDFPSDINNTSRNPYTKVDIDLVDNGVVISSGYLKYKKVEDNVLSCTFFAENTDWINSIKNKSLKDLNFEDLTHTWDSATMKIRIDSDPTEGYCYPVINYGLAETTYYGISDIWMFPAMFIHTIVSAIFNEAGWTLRGSMLDLPMYQRLILPFSDEEWIKPGDTTFYTTTFEPFDAITGINTSSTNTLSVGASTLQPTNDGAYQITVIVNITVTSNVGGLTIDVNLIQSAATIATGQVVLAAGVTGAQEITVTLATLVFDVPTDLVTVDAVFTYTSTGLSVVDNDGSIVFLQNTTYLIGDTIEDMASTLPDMTQVDFIKYIFFIFGVLPNPNSKTKNVTLDLFRDVKDSTAVDWSDKLDLSRTVSTDYTELLKNYASISDLKYKEDANDDDAIQYKREYVKEYGSGKFTIDNELIKDVKTIYTAPFSPVWSKVHEGTQDVYMAHIPYLDPDDPTGATKNTIVPKIAIMTKNVAADSITGGGATYDVFTIDIFPPGGTQDHMDDVPITYFSKVIGRGSFQPLTLFNDYNNSLDIDASEISYTGDIDLKSAYLADYEELLSNAKYIKAYFLLNEVDINQLDFSKRIYIDKWKAYFYIAKVKNYKGDSETTLCELIKL